MIVGRHALRLLSCLVDSRTGMPRVGMVGGGQLARMTHQSAIALGQSLRVLSLTPDESAALVAPDVEIGSHLDLDALTRFAQGATSSPSITNTYRPNTSGPWSRRATPSTRAPTHCSTPRTRP